MSKEFIPITLPDAVPGPSTAFRLKVLPAQPAVLRSPIHGLPDNVIALAIPGASKATAAVPPAAAHDHGLPSVQLQRDGDRITSIQITCSCGGLIKLDCAY